MPDKTFTLIPSAPAGFKMVPIKPKKRGRGVSFSESTERIIESWIDHMLQSHPVKRPNYGEAIARAADTLHAAGWMPGCSVRLSPAAGSASPLAGRQKPASPNLRKGRRPSIIHPQGHKGPGAR